MNSRENNYSTKISPSLIKKIKPLPPQTNAYPKPKLKNTLTRPLTQREMQILREMRLKAKPKIKVI